MSQVAAAIQTACKRLNIEMPEIHMEPGRSIVGAAGMTLYTCGTVKKIPGYKNYVSIDGGMPDNPRYALYKANYTCLLANKMNEKCDFEASVVGRGDTVAVCTTGAYNYSMASNYNRLPRPATVMLSGGKSYIAIRRETFEDLCACDL